MGDHPAIIAGHVAGEVAPVAAMILALIGGSLVGGGLSTLVAAPVCFAVAALATYSMVERATYATVVRPTAPPYVEAAREKLDIPAVIAGLGLVAMIVGFAPGLVLAALGIVMVGALTVPVRSHISDQIARRVETANGLGAVLGLSPERLLEDGGWGAEVDGIWIAPLPHSSQRLLDNLSDAAGLVARSMPDWMLDPRRPPGPNGLWLVPTDEAERQRREHLRQSGACSRVR